MCISLPVANYLQFTVQQTSVRMYAHEPELLPAEQHAAIVLLHGAGGNLDFWASRLVPFLAQAGIAFYAPHYFDRTKTTYADLATITDGVHAPLWIQTVDEAVRFVASRPGVDPDRIVLAGISLGAFLGLAFAAELSAMPDSVDHARLRAVLEISGGLIDPYLSQATERFPPTLILHGAADNVVPAQHAISLDNRLTELSVAHCTEVLPNESHWFSGAALSRILLSVSSFLQDHLQPKGEHQRAM